MSEQEGKKVLSLGGAKPKLELKKPMDSGSANAGLVRQSFSHGRSKTVAVEVKRKREGEATSAGVRAVTLDSTTTSAARPMTSGGAPRQLTKEERDARARALRGAVLEGGEVRRSSLPPVVPTAVHRVPEKPAVEVVENLDSETLRQRELAELQQIQQQEKVAAETRKKEDEVRRRDLVEGRRSDDGRMRAATAPVRPGGTAAVAALPGRPATTDEEEERNRKRRRAGLDVPPPRGAKVGEKRRDGRVNLQRVLSGEEGERTYSVASMRRRIQREKRQMNQDQDQQKLARDVVIPELITVQELANRMAERAGDVIKALMKLGTMATITQSIDADTAELVASEFGHRIKRVTEADVEQVLVDQGDTDAAQLPRPPVVTVMGHVDHGKTSLLDALRKTDVAAGEAGGITQHIGAYQVILPKASHGFDRVTFIDTPGHAAFTEMRARGAHVTDVVVLVVAADDGIMPQTIEAIRHAKAAKAPMIVAINKCDLPGANPMRVRQDLLQHDVQVEDMGGDVLSVEISAKTRMGLDKLLDAILLQAEILELKSNPNRAAVGAVIEAKLEKGRGSVATVLVQKGTLKVGDIFVAGSEWGRVRALVDDRGRTVTAATPAQPVEVIGLTAAPQAGDDFTVVETEAKAREVSEFRQRKRRQQQVAASGRGSLEQMLANIKSGQAKELAVLIKGDVHGSVEAIKGALEKIIDTENEVRVRVLDAAVGAITESDVTLANASKAIIIGFNVRANPQARDMARRDGVDIRYYAIIYNVIDDIKLALSGMLAPTLREKFLGNAQILQVFNITKVGKVAGCKVVEGVVKRGAKVRLLRDNVVIHEGSLKTLKRMKDEVKEVSQGYECGMAFENYDNIEANDVIECFEMEEIARAI
ncbi:MAG: translation initiation factor IF-2 [Alphaproteobacteria bacterium]|nr:translation initiation factor IF-2 [Alphaproteobacteria bacterium]